MINTRVHKMTQNMTEQEMKARGIDPRVRFLQGVTPVWKDANYSKFYGLLRQLPGDREEIKRQLVLQYTCNRTDSLRELSKDEYYRICDRMRELIYQSGHRDAAREELRYRRSVCLKLMQKLGIDTTDWTRVNAFCQDGRIVGKQFRDISTEELEALAVKLRSIQRRGGLRQPEVQEEKARIVSFNK